MRVQIRGIPAKQDRLAACSVRALGQRVTTKFNELERGVHTDPDQFSVSLNKYGEIYKTAKQAYADVHVRADQFQALALKSLGSDIRKVGKREAGTRLTLNLAAVDASGRSPIGDVSYFVETTIPLVVHGGLVYSRLNDVTFQKVKRAAEFSEEDVFQKTDDDANSRNFTMFMGWRLATLDGGQPNTSRFSALISLGTDIDSPGKKVYLAPTLLLFNRVAISYGGVFGKESNGEQQTLEPDVFRIIKEKTERGAVLRHQHEDLLNVSAFQRNIQHLVVLMMENRSYDHMLGFLGTGDGLTGDEFNVPDLSQPGPKIFVSKDASYASDFLAIHHIVWKTSTCRCSARPSNRIRSQRRRTRASSSTTRSGRT